WLEHLFGLRVIFELKLKQGELGRISLRSVWNLIETGNIEKPTAETQRHGELLPSHHFSGLGEKKEIEGHSVLVPAYLCVSASPRLLCCRCEVVRRAGKAQCVPESRLSVPML